MHLIDKQFSFCYGHRVWVQELEEEFCARGDTKTKCRHMHGHEGLVHVFLEGDELNKQGMVTDFKHLGWLKNFLDDYIDHKFILDINDPFFESIAKGKLISNGTVFQSHVDPYIHTPLINVFAPETNALAGQVIDLSLFKDAGSGPYFSAACEYYDGLFFVDFVPTSENLSKWLFELVDAKMRRIGVQTSRIDWFETPKSRASYSK